jgi:hypothetical protein
MPKVMDLRIVLIVLVLYAMWVLYIRPACSSYFQDMEPLASSDFATMGARTTMRSKPPPGTMLFQKSGKDVTVPSPVPLQDLAQNFLLARQVEGGAIDTKLSQRKGAAYLDLRPDIPIVMDRSTWMNASSISDTERNARIDHQRRVWGNVV